MECAGTREHILEPRERLDAASLAGNHKTAKHGHRSATGVAAKEGPVAKAERNVAVGSFRGAVVDVPLAFLKKLRQCVPLFTRFTRRLPKFG
jgi:hypothetical protein